MANMSSINRPRFALDQLGGAAGSDKVRTNSQFYFDRAEDYEESLRFFGVFLVLITYEPIIPKRHDVNIRGISL